MSQFSLLNLPVEIINHIIDFCDDIDSYITFPLLCSFLKNIWKEQRRIKRKKIKTYNDLRDVVLRGNPSDYLHQCVLWHCNSNLIEDALASSKPMLASLMRAHYNNIFDVLLYKDRETNETDDVLISPEIIGENTSYIYYSSRGETNKLPSRIYSSYDELANFHMFPTRTIKQNVFKFNLIEHGAFEALRFGHKQTAQFILKNHLLPLLKFEQFNAIQFVVMQELFVRAGSLDILKEFYKLFDGSKLYVYFLKTAEFSKNESHLYHIEIDMFLENREKTFEFLRFMKDYSGRVSDNEKRMEIGGDDMFILMIIVNEMTCNSNEHISNPPEKVLSLLAVFKDYWRNEYSEKAALPSVLQLKHEKCEEIEDEKFKNMKIEKVVEILSSIRYEESFVKKILKYHLVKTNFLQKDVNLDLVSKLSVDASKRMIMRIMINIMFEECSKAKKCSQLYNFHEYFKKNMKSSPLLLCNYFTRIAQLEENTRLSIHEMVMRNWLKFNGQFISLPIITSEEE